MRTTEIRERLHRFIDNIEDKKAEAIYTLFEAEIDIDAKRRDLIKKERLHYLNGNESSFSWDEVKGMAADKAKRHVL